MANSIFKTGSKWGLSVALAASVAWWLLPLSVTHYAEVSRGNSLSKQLDGYHRQHNTLPNNDDWQQLKQVGFTSQELETAYPEYHKVDNTAYELTFITGFDGPYLMWNSQERQWKTAFPAVQAR